jgi:hypothetical protein
MPLDGRIAEAARLVRTRPTPLRASRDARAMD